LNPGIAYAALAFTWWGLFPLYFRLVAVVPPGQILAHRIVWCLVFVLAILGARRQWSWLPPLLRSPRVLLAFAASALLIAANWIIYIVAVQDGHVIDASLGYFINPLINVLIGTTLLRERLRPTQWAALSVAGGGVVWLTMLAGHPPWIALALAVTFAAYGLLRKTAALGALEGLTLETLLLAPLALAGLWMAARAGQPVFPANDMAGSLWLIGLGPITAVPLLLFAAGARRLTMTTLGLLQYIGPTVQFALGLWVFHEPFDTLRLVGFGLIWLALLIYTLDGWRWSRRAAPVAAPA
jgi:chloramphenicol-sensitive protein RarD